MGALSCLAWALKDKARGVVTFENEVVIHEIWGHIRKLQDYSQSYWKLLLARMLFGYSEDVQLIRGDGTFEFQELFSDSRNAMELASVMHPEADEGQLRNASWRMRDKTVGITGRTKIVLLCTLLSLRSSIQWYLYSAIYDLVSWRFTDISRSWSRSWYVMIWNVTFYVKGQNGGTWC